MYECTALGTLFSAVLLFFLPSTRNPVYSVHPSGARSKQALVHRWRTVEESKSQREAWALLHAEQAGHGRQKVQTGLQGNSEVHVDQQLQWSKIAL